MCKKINLFIFIFFLFTTKIWAKSHILIISGDTKESRFKKNVEFVAEKARKEGREVYIMAGKGKGWNPDGEEEVFSALVKRNPLTNRYYGGDFEEALKTIGSKMAKGDSLTLMITGHGIEPSSEVKPETGGIGINSKLSLIGSKINLSYPSYLSFFELEDLIEKYLSPDNKVKIISVICYGGGAHTISTNLPNACSSSITDYRTLGWTYTYRESAYVDGFWGKQEPFFDFNRNGKHSFFERHWQGLYFDENNESRGTLSSEAFLNKKLKLGAYDLTRHSDRKFKPFAFYSDVRQAASPLENLYYQVVRCSFDGLVKVPYIDVLSNLASVLEDNMSYDIAHIPEVPDEIKFAVSQAKYWKKKEFSRIEENYRSKFVALKEQWDNLSSGMQDTNREYFINLFKELEEKAKFDAHRLLVHYKLVQYGKKINKFLASNPSEKDKKTLWRLMECEVEAL